MIGVSSYGDGVELAAEAEIQPDALVVRCAAANLGTRAVYLLHLDYAGGTPFATIHYAPGSCSDGAGEDVPRGWALLYAGGLDPVPGKVPCFPARNAGEPIMPHTALAVAFRFPRPLLEPDLAASPELPYVELTVRRLQIRLQYAPQPAEPPPPAPVRGFDLLGTKPRVVGTSLDLEQPLAIRCTLGRAARGHGP